MDPDWNSTCSRSNQKQNPPKNGVGSGKSEDRWEPGSNGCGARRKTRKWHRLLFLSHTHTRTKHTLPHLPPTQRLNYPSTLMSTRAEGRHTAVPTQEGCSEGSESPGCGRARVRGHPPPNAFLSPAWCHTAVWATASPQSRLGGSYEYGCSSEPTCRRCGAPGNPLPLLARGNGTSGLSAPQQVCSAPGGESKSSAKKTKEELPNFAGGAETGGKGAVRQPCAGSLTSLRVREEGPLHPGKALRLLSSSCYFLLLQWDCLATSIIPPRCVTGKILSSILMAFLRFTRPLVDLTTTITTTKASVKTSSPA